MSKKRASHCFVPGCSTQYKNSRLSMFSPPKDENMLKKWKILIRRSDKEITAKSCVCELHFQKKFILKNYVHIINGETVTIPRGKPILKKDAIPTIFPNRPRNQAVSLPNKRKYLEYTSLDKGNTVEDPIAENKYSKISVTLDDLRNIKLPTQYWGVINPVNNKNSLIFHISALKFSKNCPTLMTERLVIVKDENSKLKCEVYLKGLKVEEYSDISSKEMLQNILNSVNMRKIYEGAGIGPD